MNEICRLCLTVPSQKMCTLTEESDILSKIWSSMSIQITIRETLPNKVCNVCTKKIYDIYKFHKEITLNEQKLLNYLKNDMGMENFLRNSVKLKEETPQTEDTNFSDYETTEDCKSNLLDQVHVPLLQVKDGKSVEKPKHTSLNSATSNKLTKHPEIDDSEDDISLIELKEKDSKSNKTCSTKEMDVKLDSGIAQWDCLTCFHNCNSQVDLIKHYETVHNWKCSEEIIDNNKKKICSRSGNTSAKMQRKETRIVPQKYERPYVCKLCGRTYQTVYEIVRHGRAHNGSKLFCSYMCGYSTAYKGSLKEHETRRHGKSEYKYTCEKCGKGFLAKTWHDQHQNIHNNVKPFVCDICGLAFHMHRYLTTHRSTVHPQTSNVKRYRCVKCLLPCDSKNSLRLHMEEHGIKTNLLCDMCGKVFQSAEQLKHHKNVHLGVKPYACSICTKKFTKKFNMKQHERTHTGERSHACTVCGKSYAQRSALLRHNRSQHA